MEYDNSSCVFLGCYEIKGLFVLWAQIIIFPGSLLWNIVAGRKRSERNISRLSESVATLGLS